MSLSNMHVNAVKREVEEGRMIPTKSIESIIQTNLDTFNIEFNGGPTNIAEIIEIKSFIDNALIEVSDTIELFTMFHKDSPIKTWDKLERNESRCFSIGLLLKRFIDISSREGADECDYELSKLVIKEFEDAGNSVKGIFDKSYSDYNQWWIESETVAKKFSKFIYNTYISPLIKEKINAYNIKKINFGKEQITFDYKK